MLNTFLKQMEFLFVLVAGFLFLSGHAFGAEATVSDKFAQVRGFKVEITGQTGKEVDTAWEAVNGGELVFDLLRGRFGLNWEAEISLTGGSTVEAETLRKWKCEDECLVSLTIKPRAYTSQRELDEKLNAEMPTFEFSKCHLVEARSGTANSGENRTASALFRCQIQWGKEARQFNTLSNASKSRHDTAMNAIRNMK